MNEYLEKQEDGSYNLVLRGECLKNGDIEVPKKACEARLNGGGNINFIRSDGCWMNNSTGGKWYPPTDHSPHKLVWKRSEEKPVSVEGGMKFDSEKPRFSLLPKGAVNSIIDVLEFGAKKYDVDNWQQVKNSKERYYNAAMRHIDLWWNGEKFDKETGLHHLAHAVTNLIFLKWFDDNESSEG